MILSSRSSKEVIRAISVRSEYLSVVTYDAKGYFLEGDGGTSGMMSENVVK